MATATEPRPSAPPSAAAGASGNRNARERAWREWMMVGVGLTALLSILATIVSVASLAGGNSGGTTTIIREVSPPAAGTAGMMGISRSGGAAPANSGAAGAAKDVKLTIKPDSKLGPDGKKHDAFWPNTNLTVKAGETVRVTVYNYDDMDHSFTSPGLAAGAAIPATERQMQGTPHDLKVMPAPGVGVDQVIPSGSDKRPSKTTFTFTAPKTAGEYIWYCKLPCDAWAMAHFGYMMGHIKVAAA